MSLRVKNSFVKNNFTQLIVLMERKGSKMVNLNFVYHFLDIGSIPEFG